MKNHKINKIKIVYEFFSRCQPIVISSSCHAMPTTHRLSEASKKSCPNESTERAHNRTYNRKRHAIVARSSSFSHSHSLCRSCDILYLFIRCLWCVVRRWSMTRAQMNGSLFTTMWYDHATVLLLFSLHLCRSCVKKAYPHRMIELRMRSSQPEISKMKRKQSKTNKKLIRNEQIADWQNNIWRKFALVANIYFFHSSSFCTTIVASSSF